jgi:hypothetical protein
MSVEMSAAVWTRLNLSGGKLILALALAEHADPDGTSIYPSLTRLAWYTRQDERTVRRQMRELQKLGWLVLVCDRVSKYRTREYRISPVWVKGGKLPGVPERPPRKASAMPERGAMDAEMGDKAMPPYPSLPIKTPHSRPGVASGSAREAIGYVSKRKRSTSPEEPLADRLARAAQLLKELPDITDYHVARVYGLSDAQAAEVRSSMMAGATP